MAYPPTLFGKTTSELKGTTVMPDKNALTRLVHDATGNGTDHVVVDIEHWPLDGPRSEVETNIDRLLQVAGWVKEADPDISVGYYGIMPVRSLDKSTSHISSGDYQEWRQTNQDLKVLAEKVDAFFPSLYTFTDDRELWVKEAKAQIRMARELNPDIPVFAFLRPQYHGYYGEFNNRFIEEEFWKLQLQNARKYADRIVLWMPSSAKWNNDARWWVATRRFMVKM